MGGCVGQVGMQAANVTRTAWLQAGLPLEAAATTVNTQCGSSQQATNMATALVAAGVVDVAVACGVEVMSAVPMGSSVPKDPFVGKPINKHYWEHYENTSQFEGAERIAETFGVSRDGARLGSASSRRTGPRPPGPKDASTRRSCRSTPRPAMSRAR